LIKTVYVTVDSLTEEKLDNLKAFDAILLDSFIKGQYGGTGKTHDWTLSRQIREAVAPTPVVLAGGLNPENVKEAILSVQPYAVDVASGVELRPAAKDHGKVRAFIENAKQIKLTKGE
jgi:phosphoribosylanthranilate isomerase